MLGWIICREGTCEKLKTRTVCGVPFLVLETPAPRRWRERRVLTAALRKMAQWGVRRAVVQGGELPELAAFGILPLDPFPLRLALLPKLLTWVDREWSLGLKSAAVLLSADSSGGETLRAARELARRARYVLLDTGPGQAALEAELHQRLGLGSGGGPAVLEVGLGQRVRGGIPSLYLGRGCGAQQRLTVWSARLPEAEESMLCALFLAEKLSIGDIQVRFVEFRA